MGRIEPRDLLQPEGLQERFSEPVALLLDEPAETLAAASEAGFRFFTSVDTFRRHARPEEPLA